MLYECIMLPSGSYRGVTSTVGLPLHLVEISVVLSVHASQCKERTVSFYRNSFILLHKPVDWFAHNACRSQIALVLD